MSDSTRPDTVAPALAARSTRWLHGPLSDLMLGCGGLFMLIFVVLCVVGPGISRVAPLGMLPMLAVFFSAPHYGATLLRVYENRASRRKYAVFSVGVTLLLVAGFFVSLFEYTLGMWLVTLYANWNAWHYSGQNYGLSVMFLRRRLIAVPRPARRLLYASFVLSAAVAILAMNVGNPRAMYGPQLSTESERSFGPVYHVASLGMPEWLADPLLYGTLAVYVLCVAGAVGLLLRRASLSELFPSLLLIFTQALWFALPVAFRAWGLFDDLLPFGQRYAQYTFMWVAFGHALQYLWVTSFYAQRTTSYPGLMRYWLRCLLVGSTVWNLPPLILAGFALGTVPYTEGLFFLIAAVVNLHHFILDGAIWKLRDDGIGKILLRAPSESHDDEPRWQPTTTSRRASRLVIAATGAICIAVATIFVWEREVGFRQALAHRDVARMETAVKRLEMIGRPKASYYRALASIARQEGKYEHALALLGKSLALRDHPTSRFAKGLVHMDRGEWDAAVDEFEHANRLRPRLEYVDREISALVAAGRMEQARETLAGALELYPDSPVLLEHLHASAGSDDDPSGR